VKKNLATALIAATLSLGGVSACAESQAPKESSKETTMEDPAIAEADKAAQAAEEAVNRADQQKRRAHPESSAQEENPQAITAPAIPWSVMQRRIATLIASIHLPDDTHPNRVENILSVVLAKSGESNWKAEGAFSEGWEYSISINQSGTEELNAGYDIYIYLMPSKEFLDRAAVSPETLCTWSMDEFSTLAIKNGYVKGLERKLANEVWEFYDLTSNKTYNRYLEAFVYRFKDRSGREIPCVSRIHLSTGYKEEKQ
jgi:flagellar basal body L-ring protein FlgH